MDVKDISKIIASPEKYLFLKPLSRTGYGKRGKKSYLYAENYTSGIYVDKIARIHERISIENIVLAMFYMYIFDEDKFYIEYENRSKYIMRDDELIDDLLNIYEEIIKVYSHIQKPINRYNFISYDKKLEPYIYRNEKLSITI